MSQRIRQLEDALKISHASHSTERHPLLLEEQLAIKAGVDLLTTDGTEEDDVDDVETQLTGLQDLAMSLGTLAISEKGDTRFVGNIGAEVRIDARVYL